MFKHRAIKKYGKKLRPYLVKRYGEHEKYTASQIRATVYQCNFNPKHLPLGYILFLAKKDIEHVIQTEFPDLCIETYKNETTRFLHNKNNNCVINLLQSA